MTQASSPVQRLLATDAGWGTLALRVPAGIIFMAHGAQKLFGWFGGYGLAGTGQWLDSIGLTGAGRASIDRALAHKVAVA